MSRLITQAIILVFFATCLASGCASSGGGPPRDLRPDELSDFQSRLLGTVVQELNAAGLTATIRELRITESHRLSDGSVTLGYHLSFDTQDPESGSVGHAVDSELTIAPDTFQLSDNERIVVWRLVSSKPFDASLSFHDPLIIQTRLPATPEN